jgi:hypothetical protein
MHRQMKKDRTKTLTMAPVLYRQVQAGTQSSAPKEMLVSLMRHYQNSFQDTGKQDAMNLFLGMFGAAAARSSAALMLADGEEKKMEEEGEEDGAAQDELKDGKEKEKDNKKEDGNGKQAKAAAGDKSHTPPDSPSLPAKYRLNAAAPKPGSRDPSPTRPPPASSAASKPSTAAPSTPAPALSRSSSSAAFVMSPTTTTAPSSATAVVAAPASGVDIWELSSDFYLHNRTTAEAPDVLGKAWYVLFAMK